MAEGKKQEINGKKNSRTYTDFLVNNYIVEKALAKAQVPHKFGTFAKEYSKINFSKVTSLPLFIKRNTALRLSGFANDTIHEVGVLFFIFFLIRCENSKHSNKYRDV